jgi:C4-dicarboxylate-specific signal transduction histidine kinase
MRMTIKQKLFANLATTLSLLALSGGVMAWAWQQNEKLYRHESIVNKQVRSWLTLKFQVNQYVKQVLEHTARGKAATAEEIVDLAGQIISSFIQLEREIRAKERLLAAPRPEERGQLVLVRSQFGRIHEELEKSILLAKQGQEKAALNRIYQSITQAGLEQRFINLVALQVIKEEEEVERIEQESARLKKKAVALLGGLLLLSLALSAAIIRYINQRIYRSISLAQSELLRGAEALGAGDLHTTIHINTKDELSVVGQAFNKMTQDLRAAGDLIDQQRQQIAFSSKMSALGEMAGGVAHEINNPLAIIKSSASIMRELLEDERVDRKMLGQLSERVEATTDRIARIVQGLRFFSRDGSKDPPQLVRLQTIVSDTLSLCQERFKSEGTNVLVEDIPTDIQVEGRPTEISQVLLNLLSNAHDAVAHQPERWIKLSTTHSNDRIEIRVIDSGPGVSRELRAKIFQPFFTTKEVGKGTGLGLSVSNEIAKKHGGELKLDESHAHTCFVVRLPKRQPTQVA